MDRYELASQRLLHDFDKVQDYATDAEKLAYLEGFELGLRAASQVSQQAAEAVANLEAVRFAAKTAADNLRLAILKEQHA